MNNNHELFIGEMELQQSIFPVVKDSESKTQKPVFNNQTDIIWKVRTSTENRSSTCYLNGEIIYNIVVGL